MQIIIENFFIIWVNVIVPLLKQVGIILPLLIGVAYFTLAERKVLSAIQRRRGPNVVGIFGLFTPLADGLKLFVKEMMVPTAANPWIYWIAPIITFLLALAAWTCMPIGEAQVYADLDLSLLVILAISSLAVYGVLMAGWSSNSKYAFLGSLRSGAQMVSYEVSIGFILVSVILCAGSMNLSTIVEMQRGVWFIVPLFPAFLMFIVSILAETARHPFDLPEAEAELVAGYNVEYTSMSFAFFFLGEYGNMILMSVLTVVLFLGGWLSPLPFLLGDSALWLAFKSLFLVLFFIGARGAYPRYRYDQLMDIGWKTFLPCALGYLILVSGVTMCILG
jgi:NADH-quinone oxidoreductase subunit H